MFCTTECWSCEDKSCEHYISKEKLYFENQQLQERINKAIDILKLCNSECAKETINILKGE